MLENFIIHPDYGSEQRTDADLLGVRFKYREELLENPMKDDPVVSECDTFCNIIIAEVKRSQCSLNGPWTKTENDNMLRILRAIGCINNKHIREAAKSLYTNGQYKDDIVTCRLYAFGESEGNLKIPNVPQILFNHVIEFIYSRFQQYRNQKSSVGNWAEDGRKLREFINECHNLEKYKYKVREFFNLNRNTS